MSDSSIDALIEEGRRIHSAATPGTWHAWDRGVGWMIALDPDGNDLLPEGLRTDLDRRQDAEAIAWAHNHLPGLLDLLEQWREIARDRRDDLVIARARIEELEAQRARALGHTIPRGGGEFEHDHDVLEGHDGCPACWAEDIREALGQETPQ
ncbi:hypothetical protein [Nocardia farcinica]|uniref:hypothetical protein n=1 Tax=Nocardia farcinica TaxID=37329 RepID=UPI0024586344|nr:hypothetical protein [Nocardia farcinica]